MNCWTLLQLPEDADERSIKRSYARLLKSNRPDEDAEGFQRLREAYEHALEIARWRDDDSPEEAPPLPMAVLTADAMEHAQTYEWSWPADIQPLNTRPAAPVRDDPIPSLLADLTEQNLPERWQQARQQQCADAFQQALLNLCFEQPGLRRSIAAWAVQQLEWLTPWQTVRMTPWQAEALSSGLLQEYRQALQDLLEAGQERPFLQQLKHYSQQPWMKIFDRNQEWQRIVLQLLNDTQWSVPLFDRVCQAFGWDDQAGVTPEPLWIWQSLNRRCKREAFYGELQTRALNHFEGEPVQKAAFVLLTPLSLWQLGLEFKGFTHSHWQACQDLADQLTHRYPELIERLPNPDVFFWRKFLPRAVPTSSWRWLWAGCSLALILSAIPAWQTWQAKGELGTNLLVSLLTGLVPVIVGTYAMNVWQAISRQLLTIDLWLSEYLLPKRINPNRYWLVIRHGVPQAVIALLFLAWSGGLGMATFIGIGAIGLFDSKRQGGERPESIWRHPWQAILHFTHWSPLQLGFFLLMLCITITCLLVVPGYPLTADSRR
ncbi:J domain-containing protein [Pseudomonas sp. MWU12-2037]|uniref:J domain-containing protein n=1 Tax=Pseudomonas sp. MWU12-2037 TaxID=2928690 RepID=UPI00200D9765|nr:J domain-containing protein [Pseudomonas sp. MWU12-2037]